MRIWTIEDLSRTLTGDLVWRRKENLYMFGAVEKTVGSNTQPQVRGAIAVLYAHWEGYVKSSGQAYLEFVRGQSLTYNELCESFVALAARRYITQAAQSGLHGPHMNVVAFFFTRMGDRAELPGPRIIDAHSNLTVAVFRDIVSMLGIPYREEYEVNEKPVIERMLDLRNHIAHGDYQRVDLVEYRQLYSRLDELLVLFGNDVEKAAATGGYRRAL